MAGRLELGAMGSSQIDDESQAIDIDGRMFWGGSMGTREDLGRAMLPFVRNKFFLQYHEKTKAPLDAARIVPHAEMIHAVKKASRPIRILRVSKETLKSLLRVTYESLKSLLRVLV